MASDDAQAYMTKVGELVVRVNLLEQAHSS